MRNIPFAFLNEETIDQINRAERELANRVQVERIEVDAFAHLAETQTSMRGLMTWPVEDLRSTAISAVTRTAKRFVAMLEKMMEMSGPNSIANLERALRAYQPEQRRDS